MIDNKNFRRAVELIDKSSSILITTHTKPDGDACGCMSAMCDALISLGKKVMLLMVSPVPKWYEFLFTDKVPVFGDDVSLEQLKQGHFGKFDLIVIVDTNSYSQLAELENFVKQANVPILTIDHHLTSDNLGDVELVDSSSAATGLIVLDLLKFAGWSLADKMAEALFVAIATDTGWFQFTNTDSKVYRSCAELVEAGANPADIYNKLYQNFSFPRFQLMVAMLNTLELHLNGQYATQYITQKNFEQTGALPEDTENLINECHRIGTVKVSALFVELKDGRIRCSLRSKSDVDVSKIAAKFGGGGHKMAAGTYLPGPLENAKQLIFNEVQEKF